MSQQQQLLQYPQITDVSTDPQSKETFVKAFLMDDTVNQNFWHVPTAVMKKYASSFIGRPWIIHPSGDHPNYIKEGVLHDSPTFIDDILRVQDRYKGGEIIDVTYEPTKENPAKKAWFTTIRVTNPDVVDRLKSGAISAYVSPQIYDLSKANPGESTTEFIPLHLATVNAPAYGNIARIKGLCNGSGQTCMKALKSAAVQLVQEIDNVEAAKKQPQQVTNGDSSYQKISGFSPYTTLTSNNNGQFNPNEQIIANNGYNPYQQQQVAPPVEPQQQQQFISQKTQIQEVDANGNLITRTEDKKPKTGQQVPAPQQQVAPPVQPQPQPQTIVNTPSSVAPVQQEAQIPNELLETIKGLQATIQGQNDRLSQIENFKKSAEDDKVKKASEAQRQLIEGVFTPEVIADEAARQDVVDFFVGLPLSDEDLKKVLDMVLTGTFNSATSGAPADTQQASKPKQIPKNKGNVKQASSAAIISNQLRMNASPTPAIPISTPRFLSDINVDNLLL